MSRGTSSNVAIEAALQGLGSDPLDEASIYRDVAPLFSRVLARAGGEIYLANHSLGRPLDVTEQDVGEAVMLWQTRMAGAWDPWLDEMQAYRSRLAALIGAPREDCVVPKNSAGQGMRAVLNTYDTMP